MLEHDPSEISEAELDAIEAAIARSCQPETVSVSAVRYNYEGIAEADAIEIHKIVRRIRTRERNLVTDMLATGADLIAVKSKLRHGQFKDWLKAEFDLAERSAQVYMRAAQVFNTMPDVAHVLGPASIRRLSAKSTPDHVRESVIRDVRSGKAPSAKDIDDQIKATKGLGIRKRAIASDTSQTPTKSLDAAVATMPAVDRDKHREVAAKAARKLSLLLGSKFTSVAVLLKNVDPAALDVVKEEFLKIAEQSSSTRTSTSTTTVATRIEHQPNKATAT